MVFNLQATAQRDRHTCLDRIYDGRSIRNRRSNLNTSSCPFQTQDRRKWRRRYECFWLVSCLGWMMNLTGAYKIGFDLLWEPFRACACCAPQAVSYERQRQWRKAASLLTKMTNLVFELLDSTTVPCHLMMWWLGQNWKFKTKRFSVERQLYYWMFTFLCLI